MGQIKKLLPKQCRDKIVEKVEQHLPEGSFRRRHFADGISIGGAVLVTTGGVMDLLGHRKLGAALRAAGHTGDDFDGDSARRLGTAGKDGALLDAGLDKWKILVEATLGWKHSLDAVHDPGLTDRRGRIAVIAGKHVANAALNGYIEMRGGDGETTFMGQVNAYADALTFTAWGIADAAETPSRKALFNTAGNALFVIGLGTGALATKSYMDRVPSHSEGVGEPSAPALEIPITWDGPATI